MGPNTEQMGGGGSGAISGAGENSDGMIISSGKTPAGGNKPRASRPLILGVILAVLVLVGGGVAWVVVSNLNKSGGNGEVAVTKVGDTRIETANDYKQSFLLYANYILTGVAKTDALPNGFSPDENYPLMAAYNSRNEDFISIASEYYNNFKRQYDMVVADDEGEDVVDANDIIGSYTNAFNLAKSVNTANGLSDEEYNEAMEAIRDAQIDVIVEVWNVWEVLNA